jgi:CelD/BcsL family acetyltransferase involved in cellulose biosynthesis
MEESLPSIHFLSAVDWLDASLRCTEAPWEPALLRHWRDLEEHSSDATFFQSAAWCQAWVEAAAAAGVPETPRIATIWRGQRLVLLWPLTVRRLSVFRILHSLGEPATQYGDVLIDRREDRHALLGMAWEMIRSWSGIDAVELRRVREGTAIASHLARYRVEGSRASAPILDFRSLDAASADGQRTSRTRQALRRHERLLGEYGPVSFGLILQPEEQCRLLEHAFLLKRAWQKEKGSVSTGYAHGASLDCLLRLARQGDLLAACLRAGDEIAAVEIGVQNRRSYLSLVQSYDLRFSRHAPGRLLFWHLLEQCPELSIDVFDFLAPATRHKLEWANSEAPIADYLVPITPRGHLAAAYLGRIRPLLRECYRRLPPALRQHAGSLLRRSN